MIKINLLKRWKTAGSMGSMQAGILNQLGAKGIDVSALKDIDLRKSAIVKFAAVAIAVYGLQWILDVKKQELIAEEDAKQEALQAEQDEVIKKLARVKGFEPLKKQLEDDEKIIQNKLDIINNLLENRDAPSRLMKQVSQIIPADVWLTSMRIQDGRLQIMGGATNYSFVSDFMKGLGDSTIFSTVNLAQVNEVSEQEGVKYQNFEISADAKGFQ